MRRNETHHAEPDLELTDKQVVALPYVAAAPTVAEGARRASIARSTLHRWMEDGRFRQALETTRAEAADLARTELQGLMLKAVFVLAEALEDPKPEVRLRAASTAMNLGLKIVDIKELHQRLDQLDDTVDLMRSKRPSFIFGG